VPSLVGVEIQSDAKRLSCEESFNTRATEYFHFYKLTEGREEQLIEALNSI